MKRSREPNRGYALVSLKKDFARLGAAFDALSPEQRGRVVGGLVAFSRLMSELRPALVEIGSSISSALSPTEADKLGRALRDCGGALVMHFVRKCITGDIDVAGALTVDRTIEAIGALPPATAATFRPVLAPWQG